MSRFTKTGQPIMGQTYVISQGDLLSPTKAKIVGKFYGKHGNSDLVGIMLEEPNGARTMFPWPLEAEPGSLPIRFETT